MEFTRLEREAILAIIASQPSDLRTTLEQQLMRASVVRRENTGGGFFSYLHVDADVPLLSSYPPGGLEVFVDVSGMADPLGIVLIEEAGHLSLLEGYTLAGESTEQIDFTSVAFGPLSSHPTSWTRV